MCPTNSKMINLIVNNNKNIYIHIIIIIIIKFIKKKNKNKNKNKNKKKQKQKTEIWPLHLDMHKLNLIYFMPFLDFKTKRCLSLYLSLPPKSTLPSA